MLMPLPGIYLNHYINLNIRIKGRKDVASLVRHVEYLLNR